ncbi:MAG: hypothetical protein FWH16_04335 [Oscillospiraceae bacterium]|nr:hypothetical protein [Oscillospiraceae bacterium]
MRKLLVITFIAVISAGFLAVVFRAPAERSAVEGRVYAKLSAPSLSDIRGFIGNTSNAFADQIPFRDGLTRLYYSSLRAIGMDTIDGFVFGGDEYIYHANLTFRDFDAEKAEALKHAAGMLNEAAALAASYGGRFIFMPTPLKTAADTENLPSWYGGNTEYQLALAGAWAGALSRGVTFIDLLPAFTAAEHPCFLKTDHHWNIRGAHIAYESVMSLTRELFPQVEAYGPEKYIIEKEVNVGFYNRRLGMSARPEPEELVIYPDGWAVPYTRYESGKISELPVYNNKDMDARASYAGYMSGDFAETKIETNRPELPSIMIIGDSQTNLLELFCIPSFDSMTSLDFRYSPPLDTLLEYIERDRPDIIVVTFRIDTTDMAAVLHS